MKVQVKDQKGIKVEDITLDKKVFEQEENLSLISQYIHIFKTNQRQGTSSTLTRAEVSGGGKKPWRQKGTGRARHGSIRSPIWVKGGIAHGPKPKDYAKSLPKKMRRQAMRVALSAKATNGNLNVIKEIKIDKPKTKEMENIFNKFKLGEKTLVITAKSDQNVVMSISNIKKSKAVFVDSLNVFDIVEAKSILIEKEAVEILEKRYK